ncbi:MAG: SpaA isopeptide-forming pilin-related protein, partial [Oscillospiraceae bacterium]|nr:SpaA isopeptide-forming pilin-related protein [Oscillospiraceae bacterium]
GNDIVSLACALGEQWSSGLGDSSLTSSSEKVEYMNTLGMQSNINAAFRYNLATSIAQVYQWRLYDFPLPQYDTIDPKDPATWPTNNQNITNKSGVSKDYLNLIKKAASRTFPLTGTNLTAYVQATHMLEEMMAQYNQGKQTSLVMTYTANDATSGTLTFSHDGFVPHKWDSTLDSDKTYNTILKWSGTATVKVNNGTPVSNGTTGVTVRETDTITVTGISNVVFTLTDSTNYLVSGSIKGALYEYTTNPTAYQRLHIGCAKFTTLICKLTVTASTNLTFTNKYTTPPLPATYDFEFTKVDENGNPLAGAEFTLYKKTALYTYDGPTGKTAVSGNDGTVRFTDVEPGEYAFKETAAPKGYIRNYDNDYVVVVSPNGDVEIYDDLTQTNLLEGNEVKNVPLEFGFRKTDENGKTILDEHNRPYYDPNNNYLANAEFALYASEQDAENGNNPLKAVKSGTDGAVNFSLAGIMNTIDGEQMVDFFGTPVTDSYTYTFYMKETHSPEGYEPNDTIYKIVIQNNGMYTIQWKNDSVWESLDVTPNPNPNQLFMPASTALQPLYYIRNYPKSGPRLPETGGMGMLPLKTAGIIFICGAVGAIFYRKKKESLNLSKKQKKI